MESLLDSIGALLTGLFGLAQGGVDTINQVTGLVIAVMFFIKSLFVGRGHGHRRHAH